MTKGPTAVSRRGHESFCSLHPPSAESQDPDKDTVDRMRRIEVIAKQRAANGTSPAIDAQAAKYHRARAEADAL